MTGPAIPLDALVAGHVGSTEAETEIRVFRVSPWGWVAGIDAQGHQRIVHDPTVIGPPRPEKLRVDIPAHLK
jgi:hypothetical protein